jgi:tetratricopeptide (TPR) repeat protein
MAKNNKEREAQVAEDEVIYEDESGESSSSSQGGAASLLKNRNFLIGAGVVILLVVVGIFFFRAQNPKPDNEAMMAMTGAVEEFQRDSMLAAINGKPTSATSQGFSGFADLVADYSGTPQANQAKFYLGAGYLQTGNVDLAIEYLEDFKKGNDMVSAAAYAALGSAYEEKGEFETAAGYFEKAARIPGENAWTTPFYLMQAGRNYESAGDKDAALKLYKDIYNKYPTSEEGLSVKKYIGRLDEANEL